MHKLYELKDKLIDELEGYAENGKFSKEDVEVIKYMSSAVDHLCNIMEDEEEYSGNYMYDDGMQGGMSQRESRRGGRSYARGRRGNVRRDAMGRYSRAKEDFEEELRDLMMDAPNEHVRQKMQKLISEM